MEDVAVEPFGVGRGRSKATDGVGKRNPGGN